MKTHYLIAVVLFFFSYTISAQSSRQKISFNDGWKFSLGDASSYEKDFRNGTEYFNYLTKANSIHNEGPYSQKFSDSLWQDVKLDRKSTRLNSSHQIISYAVFCLKK